MDIVKRGRLGDEDEAAAEFISGFDKWWYEPHLWIDQAHIVMLAEQGIISKEHAVKILDALDEVEDAGIESLPERGDLHVAIEETVVNKLGEDIGGRIHTGRSRNDKGATAMRVALREELLGLADATLTLRDVLLNRAEESSDYMVSGYTHLQNAQPTTVGHHLMGHAERLSRDFERIMNAYRRTNQNPLGGAALAGTGYNINRQRTTELLGFSEPMRNSMDGVSTRDFTVDAIAAAAMLATDVSCICEDLSIWSTSEFNFITLDDAHAGSSSIMPQKKNPDTAEVARARAGTVNGMLNASLTTLKGLPMAFNFDIVETTPQARQAISTASECTHIIADTVGGITFNIEELEAGASGGFSTATEVADTLVREGGISFRTAHHVVGHLSRDYSPEEISSETIDRVTEEILGQPLAIPEDAVERALDPRHNVEVRDSYGGPGEVDAAIRDGQTELEHQWEELESLQENLDSAKDKLDAAKSDLNE